MLTKGNLRHCQVCRYAALLLVSTLGLSAAAVEDYFPLRTGNRWTYRHLTRAGVESRFSIEVGLPYFAGSRVYYYVRGYAPQPLLVRLSEEDGNLYYLDEEAEKEQLLTRFAGEGGGEYQTPLGGPCPAEATLDPHDTTYRTSEGMPPARAVHLTYRTFSCADAGLEDELYVENLGLVRRVQQSIAGPQVYELESANLGDVVVNVHARTAFEVALDQPEFVRAGSEDRSVLKGSLALTVQGMPPVVLQFHSGQRFDLRLLDESGRVVYVWSADKLFIQVLAEVTVARQLRFPFEVPLSELGGGALKDGVYTLEAWLTTAGDGQAFRATASVRVTTQDPATLRKQ